MKVLTEELKNQLEFSELYYLLNKKKTLPLFFLNGEYEGLDNSIVKTVKTSFNLSDKENEISFAILPNTFTFTGENLLCELRQEKFTPEKEVLSQYTNRLRIISNLPKVLLERIKDKRLLAIGYAEPKVKKAIINYITKKINAAGSVLEKSIANSIEVAKELSVSRQFENDRYVSSLVELFDEEYIWSVRKRNNNMLFDLTSRQFVLTEVETLENGINPKKTEIRLFELHKVGEYYELHLMLKTKDENLVEHFHNVAYKFKDMIIIY